MIVLVVGPGRSGTSTVARLLHTNCRIPMGEKWVRPADNFNPKGYYEDAEFGTLLKDMCFHTDLEPAEKELTHLIRKRNADYPNWGFKANTLAFTLPFVMDVIKSISSEPPLIIRCVRPVGSVIASWVRVFQNNYRMSSAEVILREHMLDMFSKEHPMKTIDFSTRKTDEEILKELIHIDHRLIWYH